MFCIISFLNPNPAILLRDQYKQFSTVSNEVVNCAFVANPPLATSETYEYQKNAKECIHKVCSAYEYNPCEAHITLFNFFTVFIIFVRSLISVILINNAVS